MRCKLAPSLTLPTLCLVLLASTPAFTADEVPPELQNRLDAALGMAQSNRLGEATQQTHDLLKDAPDFVDAHRLYIDLLTAQGRAEDAVHFYRLALDARPDDPAMHYLYGRATNDPQIALTEFREAIRLDPGFCWAYHGLGAALALTGDVEGAIVKFEKAIELRPDLVEAHNHLANLYLSLEREDDAIAAYRRAIALAPDISDAYFYLGVYLSHHERLDEARELLEEACRLDADNPMIQLELGSLYVRLHMLPEAIATFEEGLNLDSRDEYLRDLRAVAAVVAGGSAPHELFDVFRRGLELLPMSPEDAIGAFEESIEMAPDFHLSHLNHGIGLAALSRNDEAETAIRQAIALDARYPESHAALAVVLISAERLDEAEASLQQALALDPAHVEALRGLGMVTMMDGRTELAASYFLRAAKLAPSNLGLQVELAGAYIQAEQMDKAEAALREVLRADPTFNFARHQLAALLTQEERYDESIAELEELRTHVAAGVDIQGLIDQVKAQRRAAERDSSPRIRLSQIFVKDRAMADDIVALARGGESFAALAQNHSIGATASSGGDIGELTIADMQPTVAAALDVLEVGGITDVLEMPTGYLILKRTE